MEDNRFNDLMDTTVEKIRSLVDTNTIIGTPINTPDGITLIPVSRVSFGFATGGNPSTCLPRPQVLTANYSQNWTSLPDLSPQPQTCL